MSSKINTLETRLAIMAGVKSLVKKYDTDETICLLNRVIKQLEFDNGVLTSEIAHLEAKIKANTNSHLTELASSRKVKIKELESENRDLIYQLVAHNIPIPNRHKESASKVLQQKQPKGITKRYPLKN